MNHSETLLYPPATSARLRMKWLPAVLTLTLCAALPAVAASGGFIAHNTPPYVATAKNLGPENPAKTMELNIWLKPHNRSQMDELARQLYDRNSPNYRHFLNAAQFGEHFAPSADEARAVREFLEAHSLKVVRTGANNFFVRARGTVGDVESAFRVTLNNYEVRGKVIRANDRDPYVDGVAAPFIASIAGLTNGEYEHPFRAPSVMGMKKESKSPAMVTDAAHAPFFSNVCFNGQETETFSGTNFAGLFPTATYKGNHVNEQSLTSNGCGYTPPMIQAAYNLSGLYAEGFHGEGQTIGIIDWCGSLTIQRDANAFSAAFGLPPLTSSNFAITYIPVPSTCAYEGNVEINIDVEWSHAVAPGANINLIVPPSATFLDIDEAEFTAVNYGLATVISGSYGAPENEVFESTLATENLINETAAIMGISANFSSGDDGDFTIFGIPATVSTPADSPWATGVGGISLALNSSNSIAWQSGWGTDQTLVAEGLSGGEIFVADPPSEGFNGFYGGSGGGETNCFRQIDNFTTGTITCLAGFPKPSFQSKLPGKYRQVPDISWLADPFTGVEILISLPNQVPAQVWQKYGGTSVAAPMFSALWAIAQQEAGGLLGQAAQYVYSMPSGAIHDIVPVSSPNNVHASIKDASGTTAYNPDEVTGGAAPPKFITGIWDYPQTQDTAIVLSFGTDCATSSVFPDGTLCTSPSALHTNPGWDNVTGVGVPNGKAFADAFAPAPTVKK